MKLINEKDRKWLWESLTSYARKHGPNPDDHPSTMRRLEAQYQAILLTVQMLTRCLADLKLGSYQALDYTVLPNDIPGTKPPRRWGWLRWLRWLNYTAVIVVVTLITMAFGLAIKLPGTQHPKDQDQDQIADVQAELARLRGAIDDNAKQIALVINHQNATNDRIEKIGQLHAIASLEGLIGKSTFRYLAQITPDTLTLELPGKQKFTFSHGLTRDEYDGLKLNLPPLGR